MNRAEATWELMKTDEVGGPVRDAVAKIYDGISNAIGVLLSPILKNRYEVVPATNDFSGFANALRNTWRARWFERGNPLNIAAKVVEGITSISDGIVRDAIHLFGPKRGTIVRAID